MTDDDKWLDDILSRTEREEILGYVNKAIKALYNFKTKEAMSILESLHDMLDEHVTENVEQLLDEIEEMPKPKYWTQPSKEYYDAQTYAVKEEPVNINVDVIAELRRELEMQKEELQKEIEREILARREEAVAQRTVAPEENFTEMDEPWRSYIDALKRGDWPSEED